MIWSEVGLDVAAWKDFIQLQYCNLGSNLNYLLLPIFCFNLAIMYFVLVLLFSLLLK